MANIALLNRCNLRCPYCFADGYKGYTPATADKAIDHIMVRGFAEGAIRTYDRYAPEYYMCLSDHIPVWIDVDFDAQ